MEEHCVPLREPVAEVEVQSHVKVKMAVNPVEEEAETLTPVTDVKEGQKETQARLRLQQVVAGLTEVKEGR